ncbi:MAG: CDP-glycerol glycerophosphotransferase family protein [Propionibacteriaceae bacterium]|jgi:hypothetical protein|nr:CDP-glycerol glycerophosphotransferase family protein [Propionibacteriaceae bacterium]
MLNKLGPLAKRVAVLASTLGIVPLVLTGGCLVALVTLVYAGLAAAILVNWIVWISLLLLAGYMAVSESAVSALGKSMAPIWAQALPQRVLVLVLVLIFAPAHWMTVVAVIVLGLCLCLEIPILRLARLRPIAANVPGWEATPPPKQLVDAGYWAGLAFTALSWLAVNLSWPAWTLLAIAIVNLAFLAEVGVQAALFITKRTRLERRLPKIIAELAPQFVLHWHAPAGTAYQVKMWLPYLDRIGVPYFVLVRSIGNFEEVSTLTKAPIIVIDGLEALDDIICDSLKVAFYVNTATRNDHMLRFTQLKHIQLNHGDSDKAASFNPVFRAYDKNFVAGQAAVDRFAANGVWMPREMFEIVGRPQVEDVTQAVKPIGEISAPTVLYAPTWSGYYADSDYSSLPAGVEIVDALIARGCTVIFRPHPYSRRKAANAKACDAIIARLRADAHASDRVHIFGEEAERTWSVFDCFNASDAMISDVSSVVNDYLFSEKPFAMTAVSVPVMEFIEEFPIAKASYVIDCHKGKLKGLDDALDTLLKTDPFHDQRLEARRYYLGEIPTQGYSDHFLAVCRELLA